MWPPASLELPIRHLTLRSLWNLSPGPAFRAPHHAAGRAPNSGVSRGITGLALTTLAIGSLLLTPLLSSKSPTRHFGSQGSFWSQEVWHSWWHHPGSGHREEMQREGAHCREKAKCPLQGSAGPGTLATGYARWGGEVWFLLEKAHGRSGASSG